MTFFLDFHKIYNVFLVFQQTYKILEKIFVLIFVERLIFNNLYKYFANFITLKKENIKPKRRGHSSAEISKLSHVHDPEYQAEVSRKQAEWENLVRIESAENPMIWHSYYLWARTNIVNAYQITQLQHKALNAILSSSDSLQRFGADERVFDMFISAVDEAKNWTDLFSFARSKSFFVTKEKFWCRWAEKYEFDGQLKEADEILSEGEKYLLNEPEAIGKLRRWRTNFDLRVATGRSKVIIPHI